MKIVLATGNAGKLAEMTRMLQGYDAEVVRQGHLGIDSPAETGLTFVENALIKARHCAERSGLPAVADDSGLAVPALGGEPGIYSARYAGSDAGDAANIERLLAELSERGQGDRRGTFHCVMVYLRHAADPAPVIAHGSWTGRIVETPRGHHGFGYDPVFEDPELGQTAAELDAPAKDARSHRGQALRALIQGIAAEVAG
ncbi:RdgB/HAM1 family non-canonical purine NTP pyrophosphatase [Halorhodospira halophila]|uniref:dITP/XTP pyrophosphatase n=1 Tax=Halorhodospira halophila (strain DSM 244 / SL1) TaxID=349124 RepID=IXTPA_HALHL|nr:RdgB/HAM1 family non-canonical purine NTP pyrophosphatase [Halorhodospira halophila]A1WVN6.1 RecName: Full=dITP/XTP pyrophosphatase; AltName: Full=Non-canonical purine NTP pyrophosphatase; AltName: Full=Non-standard purine NTP pyrophosphatase; AltName: Full=Nucleoside-triphosphate diphosphatase; AltName: Full=Nucleoside-triphosphate pyrophosphatase; Short=NTPase [Halorhodospira halophila SL1]ABM61748.1 non-canonical purine NTP pyrophosphatase, rdgB/HAM1 family [Halorhodospira halophila SL1]MB